MTRYSLRTVSLAALAAASNYALPAFAQDAAGADQVEQAASEEASTQSAGINEIVVTARRREETAQRAAIAIDAVSGASLTESGTRDAQDLTASVPALAIANGGGSNTSIIIRGVGNVANSSYLDAAVVPSYDGVVLGRASGAFGAAFYDLARVEVLKGPQGILYGRNATGGAINILPNRPKIGEFSGGFNISAGNYDAVSTDAWVNVPVGNSSALRVAGTRQVHDGYNRDRSDDLDRAGVRAQFLTELSDRLTVRVGGDYTWARGNGPGGSYIGHYARGNFIEAPTDTSEGLNTPAANAYRETVLGAPGFGFLNAMNRDQMVHYDYYGVNAEVNLETGIGDLTVIPAYRETKGYSYFYGPSFNTAYASEKDKQTSVEARLAGSVSMIDYVVGGFYFNESIDFSGEYNQEFVLPMQNYESGTESWAAFGQLTANLTDRLRLVGGLRYTQDDKYIDGNVTNFIAFCSLPPSPRAECQADGVLPHFPNYTDGQQAFDWLIANGFIAESSVYNPDAAVQMYPNLKLPGSFIQKAITAPSDSGTFDKLTWKASVEYDLAPDSLLYATIETGYRAGGFQLAGGNTTYAPENITAYTIGTKNRFFGNTVQLNLEAFWWKYRDQQITYFTIDPATSTLNSSTNNVGKSEIKGFDLDAIFKPFANTQLTGKVQYLDTAYQDLHLITAPPRDNYNCPVTDTGATTNTGSPILDFDCSGRPLIFSPKWTVSFGVEQTFPIGDFDLVAGADTSWRSSQYTQFNYLDFQKIDPYWKTNARIALKTADGGLSIAAYVNNIENKRRLSFAQASPIGFANGRYTDPRTYGIRISSQF